MSIFSRVVIAGVILLVLLNLGLVARFYHGQSQALQHNESMAQQQLNLRPVDNLEVIPVVDLAENGEGFKVEGGSSLLVKTDNDYVLFDVGYNKKMEDEPPLLYNMKKMGIALSDVDALAISHNHADHVGGLCYRDNLIELTRGPVDLMGKKAFTPVPMKCETANTITVERPALIGEEIGTTGPLAVQMFIPGQTVEQALLVNLRDKGLVIISGCGHPQIPDMVKTAQKITGIPVYAVVGGTHLYYTNCNSGLGGKIFGSSTLYCRSLERQEVVDVIDEIKGLGVKKVFVSTHDSDQPTLEIFAEKFGTEFETLKVGNRIRIQ